MASIRGNGRFEVKKSAEANRGIEPIINFKVPGIHGLGATKQYIGQCGLGAYA